MNQHRDFSTQDSFSHLFSVLTGEPLTSLAAACHRSQKCPCPRLAKFGSPLPSLRDVPIEIPRHRIAMLLLGHQHYRASQTHAAAYARNEDRIKSPGWARFESSIDSKRITTIPPC